jgi:hypothetical protein
LLELAFLIYIVKSEGTAVPPTTAFITLSVAGEEVEAHVGTVMVLASVVTVPPNASALPLKCAKCPNDIPAASMIFPTNVGVAESDAFAPSVVAAAGVQCTSAAHAPPAKATIEFAPVVRAPPGLKIYTPEPLRVTVVDATISIAPVLE